MVGAVIIAHGFIGNELIAPAEYILGKIEGITAVSFDNERSAFESREAIVKAMRQVN